MVNILQLKEGMKNNAVRNLQLILKDKGFKGANKKVLTIDGIFGANTLYAVKSYQASKSLTVDGIVGVNTWGSLLEK